MRRGRTLRIALALAGLGIGAWVVLQRRDELAGASVIIESLRWPWAAAALAAEAASFCCYAALGLRLLGGGGVTPGMPAMLGVTLAGNAIQNSLPGGVAFAGLYAFGQFRRLGADDVLAGWALVGVAILSNVALAIVAVAGVAVAGGEGASLGLVEVIAVIAGIAVVAAVVFMRRSASNRRPLARALTSTIRWRQRLSGRPRGDATLLAHNALERVRSVAPRGGGWWASGALAVGNWAFDVLCLVAAFRAVHAQLPWRGLLLAYGGAQLASALPFTPGGLGVVEGSLAIGLVAFGGAEEATVAAVLLYRILSFWLALPVGWATWAGIAWRNRTPEAREMHA